MPTFGVKALSDPVFPKHHIHPLPMATHKQSHLGQGRLTSWPQHLRYRFILNCEELETSISCIYSNYWHQHTLVGMHG